MNCGKSALIQATMCSLTCQTWAGAGSACQPVRWGYLMPLCCRSDNVYGLLPITAVKKASVWLMIVHQVPPLEFTPVRVPRAHRTYFIHCNYHRNMPHTSPAQALC
jgi:hypothetical protein